MTVPLVIIGCGGFGREIFSLLAALAEDAQQPWHIEGFADDAPSEENLARVSNLGTSHICSIIELAERTTGSAAVIAVGSPQVRALIAAALQNSPVSFPSLVHPDATIGRNVTLGDGAVVAAGARLSTNIAVGRHVHIDQNVTVGHDSLLGHFSRLNPHSCISGDVTLGNASLLGANSTVLPGLHVGAGAVVGAGACVVRDVPPGVTVKGVPAR